MLEEIKSWLAEKQGEGSPIFWLNGIAGIGKSTVARTIAEFAETQQILGASFFFSRTEGRTDPAVFFTTLAYQLARVCPPFKKAITDTIRNDPMIGRVTLPLQIRKLLVDPLQSLDAAPYPIVVIVDALDECAESGVKDILIQLLAHLPNLPSFRILITSRPELHITSLLNAERNERSISKIFMHNIEKSIVNSDITLYLEYRFEEVNIVLPGCNWYWSARELAFLASLAGTLFIYAVTAMYLIQDPFIRNPREQLELLLKGKGSTGSPSLPFEALDQLYDQVVDRAVPLERENRIAARFRTVVGAVVGLHAPLSLRSIEKLMNLSDGDAKAALVFLPSVIAVPESADHAPHIYHPSFPDYITDPSRCKRPQLVIDNDSNHIQIVCRCFALMSSMLKRDICGITNRLLPNSAIKGLEMKVKKSIPPWLSYAIIHWPTHLAAVPSKNEEAMARLESFCSKSLLHWIEACTLLGSLDLVIPLTRQARDWAVSRGLYV